MRTRKIVSAALLVAALAVGTAACGSTDTNRQDGADLHPERHHERRQDVRQPHLRLHERRQVDLTMTRTGSGPHSLDERGPEPF